MKIVTVVVNSPTFIEIQFLTLKKYFKGEYEFIVFNDAKDFPDFTNGGDVTLKQQIQETCDKLNIECINIDNDHHRILDMYLRHADTFNNHVLKYQRNNPDKYLLLDSDMFLIDYFDIANYSKYCSATVLQSRNNEGYLWSGLCYFDMNKIKNFELINLSLILGFDSGGMTKEWLKKQMDKTPIPSTDEIRWSDKNFHNNDIYYIKHLGSCTWDINELPKYLENNTKLVDFLKNDPRNVNGKFFCEIYDNVFLHYRAGGNWIKEGIDIHKKLSKELKAALLSILRFKKNVYSQNGEDGIIEYIFQKMNISKGNFIEFGAWDGKHLSNTYKLFLENWTGIYIESDVNRYKILKKNFEKENGITCINSLVGYGENDNLDIIIKNSRHLNKDFDFISIDVDGLDYFIFKKLNIFLPKVICIEVNAGHSPLYDKEIPINIASNNIGQSIKIICDIASQKNYFPLCYTANLFLIKNEYKDIFRDDIKNLEDIYIDFLTFLPKNDLNHLEKTFISKKIYNGFYFENNYLEKFILDVQDKNYLSGYFKFFFKFLLLLVSIYQISIIKISLKSLYCYFKFVTIEP